MPAIFHNLRRYDSHHINDSHHITQESGKFEGKINVTPNDLEKMYGFHVGEKLSFFVSIQPRNSSSESLIKHLSECKFKYLSQELRGQQLELAKQKGIYPLKDLMKKRLLLLLKR